MIIIPEYIEERMMIQLSRLISISTFKARQTVVPFNFNCGDTRNNVFLLRVPVDDRFEGTSCNLNYW